MAQLFDIGIDINKDNSSKFIGRLKRSGFHNQNYDYISNYVGGVGTVYRHLKLLYDREVIGDGLDIREFLVRVNSVIQEGKMLSYSNFTRSDISKSVTNVWMMEYYRLYIK